MQKTVFSVAPNGAADDGDRAVRWRWRWRWRFCRRHAWGVNGVNGGRAAGVFALFKRDQRQTGAEVHRTTSEGGE